MITVNGIKLYTTAEICQMLGIEAHAVARMRARGLLRYTQVRRQRMTSEQALSDYLNGIIVPTEQTTHHPRAKRGANTDKQ